MAQRKSHRRKSKAPQVVGAILVIAFAVFVWPGRAILRDYRDRAFSSRISDLVDQLAEDDPVRSEEALRHLSGVASRNAVGKLLGELQRRRDRHDDEWMRLDGRIDALWRAAGPKVIVSLIHYLRSDAEHFTAAERGRVDDGLSPDAARALGAVGAHAADALFEVLHTGDDIARWYAAKALGKVGGFKAVDALVDAAGDGNREVRAEAVRALAICEDGYADSKLVELLGYGHENTRGWAAIALSRSAERPQAVEHLLGALGNSDVDVRTEAARSLGDLREPAVEDALIDALEDAEAPVREAAASALGRVGSVKAIYPLIAMFDDYEEYVAAAGRESLYRIRDPDQLFEHLSRQVSDSDPLKRAMAVWALGRVGDARAMPALMGATVDSDGKVRAAAFAALGDVGDPAAVENLILSLSSERGDAYRLIIESLGRIGDPATVDAVAEALNDNARKEADPLLEGVAIEALARIGTEKARKAIKDYLRGTTVE